MRTPPLTKAAVPGLDSLLGDEIFPNIQPKSFLMQFDSVPFHPVTYYLREEPDPLLASPSCQGVVESEKVSPELSYTSSLSHSSYSQENPILTKLLMRCKHPECRLEMLQDLPGMLQQLSNNQSSGAVPACKHLCPHPSLCCAPATESLLNWTKGHATEL